MEQVRFGVMGCAAGVCVEDEKLPVLACVGNDSRLEGEVHVLGCACRL